MTIEFPAPVRVAVGLAALVGSVWTAVQLSAQTGTAAVAFGTRHAVALRTNGEVLTWGDNVYCQLGRTSGNTGRTPVVVMRNAKEIAAASDHSLVLTVDGKVYGWGMNPEGALGMGNTNDQCEGPALVESLPGQTIAHISTGHGFSVAVTADGDLYCSGDNSMGQCPPARGGRGDVFRAVTNPELAKNVADAKAGHFHTLILTKDRKLYALGRGRDGQLGNGKTVNGFGLVLEMTDVTSFAAGTWHSVAARADGTAWAWGNNGKSQLCDGTTTNRAIPTAVRLPNQATVTSVAAGAHGTLLRASTGALFVCGDNQFGPLGVQGAIASTPTEVPAIAIKSPVVAIGGANGAVSVDGCDLRITGSNDHGIVSATANTDARAFTTRAGLSLCGPKSPTPLADVVNPAPRGGVSGCWTTRVQEDAVASPRFAGLRAAMLAGEGVVKANAAFLAAPEPVRLRTSISAGPLDESGARMHIKAVPERKSDGTRLWANGCEVIPQVDRIGGAIAQISIFFNEDARGLFISPAGEGPKLTGKGGQYPEYDGWVLITRDGRLPWLPQTVSDRLDVIAEQRDRALAETKRRPSGVPADGAGGLNWLEKQVRDLREYRASFSTAELAMPAVLADVDGSARRKLDAEIVTLRNLSAEDQGQVDALGLESRNLERQAQVETRNKNITEAARLRARSTELAQQVRAIRQAHLQKTAPVIIDKMADFDLTNIKPGPAERAWRYKPDPSFPNMKEPNRIQVIAVTMSFGPNPQGARLDWQRKTKESFDYDALALLLQ